VRSKLIIEPADLNVALKTAPLLRWQDKREIVSAGLHPVFALLESIIESENPIMFSTPDQEVAGFAGISREDDMSGIVWTLTTPAVARYPLSFCKQAKEWLDQQTGYQILHNIADPRNTLHMRFLKHLGFKRLCYCPVGPRAVTFVEFAKLVPCAYP
jgi:hypothetical protein